ncbi:MAG TPA: hypothetical protein VG895_05590 [Patescibacteria group bacterium]|nr:hypothetical protein [Patescibacteria group bacterium]
MQGFEALASKTLQNLKEKRWANEAKNAKKTPLDDLFRSQLESIINMRHSKMKGI